MRFTENIEYRQQVETSLFDGKTKTYGAFVLRQRYGRYTISGLVASLLLGPLAYLYPLFLNIVQPEDHQDDFRQVAVSITPYSELDPPPPVPPDEKPVTPVMEAPQVATKKFVKPELKPDKQVVKEELIPTIEELKTANPGTETREGTDDIHTRYDPTVVKDTIPKPAPKSHPPPKPPPPPKDEIFTVVSKLPQFPGGDKEFARFLATNLVYPRPALDEGISGIVYVEFIVDTDGSIVDPRVIRDIGGDCGREALRVVRRMPKWIPGEQGGYPVKVRYTVPIRFMWMEE